MSGLIVGFFGPWGRRDTASKDALAHEAQAYWSESEHNSEIRDLSHWRGVGRWSSEEEWELIGERHFALFEQLCHMTETPRPIGSMLEWGPGGGANLVRFGKEVSRLYGVDISEPNLEECRNQLSEAGHDSFTPILIDANEPDACRERIDGSLDLFLCTAVYQHFPGQEYGRRITNLAGELLRDGGLAIIQTRYNDGHPELESKTRDYRKNVIKFTSYRIDEFWQLTRDAGFEPVAVVLDPEPCYAFYLLQKRAHHD